MTEPPPRHSAHRALTTAWAAAVLFHLLGNPAAAYGHALPDPRGLLPLAAAALAVAVIALPRSRRVGIVAAVVVTMFAASRLPVLPNNLLLTALLGTALFVPRSPAAAVGAVLRTGAAAYALAAFAKLNSGFIDPATSCAPLFTDRLLGSWGLSAPGWLLEASPMLTVVVEVAVAVGIIVPRTRRWAALLGVMFHGLLAYDLDQHFWDFTSALMPLFLAASPIVAARVGEMLDSLPDVPRLRADAPGAPVAAAAVAAPIALVGAASALPGTAAVTLTVGHVVWIFGGTALVVWWVRTVLRTRSQPAVPAGRWGTVAAVLVTVTVVNGTLPYLGVTDAHGWTMYSSLRVVGDDTNHLIVPPLPLRTDRADLLRVESASDPRIEAYTERDERVPRVQLERWVADTPGAHVVATDTDGSAVTLDHDTVAPSRPRWVTTLFMVRPVGDRVSCLVGYGPAG